MSRKNKKETSPEEPKLMLALDRRPAGLRLTAMIYDCNRSRQRIGDNVMKYFVFVVSLMVIGIANGTVCASEYDSKMLIGTWTIGTDSGASSSEIGAMSIQADGHIIISGVGRLRVGQSISSLSDKEAAELFRSTLIIAGSYDVASSENNLSTITVRVTEASVPSYIGTTLRLGIKIHSSNRIATGTLDATGGSGSNPALNNIWRRLGSN
jgi:hypothetical protein